MIKKVTLTNVNSGRSEDIIVVTDDDSKALVGAGKASNEVAKISNITGADEAIYKMSMKGPSMDDRVNLFSGIARCLERNISTIKSFELQANRVKSPIFKGIIADIAFQIVGSAFAGQGVGAAASV